MSLNKNFEKESKVTKSQFMKKLFNIFLLFVGFTLSFAQQYPVKLFPNLLPPYSLKLGDYATSTDNKLQLQVLMTDLMEPQHQTGLKFSLEAGLNAVPFAQSNDFVVGMQPFTLFPGSNLTLTNIDVRALFELQNLNGINAVQYAQPLSDGVYRYCFQAYDYFTKRNLSDKSCATVFLVQYDPPMLNLPQNAEKVQAVSPYSGGSGIVFQWMPRQIAPNTKYIFTLKELWDLGQSPISGFLSSPPLWREETYAPTLYYGVDKTQLIPGKRYAWQVQAKSGNPVIGANPTDDNGVYKNNGLSEIFYFDYVENCAVPTLLMAKNSGRGRVELSWSLAGQPSSNPMYSVQYRKRGSTSQWQTVQSYQSRYIVTGLEDQTEYEYRIGSVCGNLQTFNNTNPVTDGDSAGNAYAYSGVQFFTTDSKDKTNQNYQCGVMPTVDIANKNPLQSLLGANEVFTAGDFPVTVISAQGSNGIYSGTGYIQVPYLADTKVIVSFNNIKLNTDKKLIDGTIETTYDPNETAIYYASNGNGINDGGNNGNNGGDNNGDSGSGNNGSGNNGGNGKGGYNNGGNNGNGNNNGDNGNGNNGNGNNGDNGNNGNNNGGNNDGNTGNNGDGTNNSNGNSNNGNNNNETTYGIKYLNKVYKDGDAITIPYKRGLKGTFEMVGPIKDSKIDWIFAKPGETVSFNVPGSYQPKEEYKLDFGMSKFRIGTRAIDIKDKPTVFVDITLDEKKFKIKDFSISENSNRVAKDGETLYYINKNGVTDIKKTDFKFNTDIPISESDIRPENIIWNLDNKEYSEGEGKKNINDYTVKEKNMTVSVTAGNTDKITKSANIKWVDGYNIQFDVVSPAVKNALNQLSNYVNNIGSVLRKLDNTGKLAFNISFQGQEYVEEDIASRFYNIRREGGFGGSIDLEFKGFTYGADLKIATAQLYLKPILSVTGNGKMQYVKRNDKDSFTETGTVMTFGLQADLKVGGEIGFDIKAITAKLEPYAGISSWGDIKYFNNTKMIQGNAGIGKPYVGIKGDVLLNGYNVLPSLDYKYTWEEIKQDIEIKINLK